MCVWGVRGMGFTDQRRIKQRRIKMNENATATLLVLFVIFLVCREIVCWYWKMNETVKLLKQIRDELQRIGGK